MNLSVNIPSHVFNAELMDQHHFPECWKEYQKTINSEDYGFFRLNINQEDQSSYRKLATKHADKKNFLHVGIGGSALGAEFLINSLASKEARDKFVFLNNIDSVDLAQKLEGLSPQETVCYIVTKSGGTAETMASLAILSTWFQKAGISKDQFKDHFVFSTDPEKGDLLDLGRELDIPTLVVPSNVGGRYSVMTSVGLFPAAFAGLDLEAFQSGLDEARKNLNEPDLKKNKLYQLACHIAHIANEYSIHQTVVMPYSSKLRTFSDWFVQLWAESLGKKNDLDGKKVERGLTPIAAYGATDQHSQMQLFMHGPHDKMILLIEVQNPSCDFKLDNEFTQSALKHLSGFGLNQLMKAEYEGTKKALAGENRSFVELSLSTLDEKSLAQLILLSESLTVLVGQMLHVDPFDQPGVEAGKKFAKQWLSEHKA